MLRIAGPALAVGLVAAPVGSAALTARLSIVPERPRTATASTLTLRPLWPRQRPDGSCCRYEPADVRYRFLLQALGPGDSRFDFWPSRTRDRFVWRARLRFPRPGRWELRVSNFYRSDRDAARAVRYPASAPRLRILVVGAAPSSARSTATTCSAREVRAFVARFIRAFNAGDLATLDVIFARDWFQWFSSGAPGVRLRAEAFRRDTLLAYFARRHALHDRLRLLDLNFNGNAGGHGHFDYLLRRSADDHENGAPFLVRGKGAIACTVRPRALAVWSMGAAGTE